MLTITCSENARKVENICQHLLQITPVAQTVKNLPAMQETVVQSLGQKDPLEKGWQPTPVFLPGESHGQWSLMGHSPWGHTESDMTEATWQAHVKNILECETFG